VDVVAASGILREQQETFSVNFDTRVDNLCSTVQPPVCAMMAGQSVLLRGRAGTVSAGLARI